jgi:hypothetical protein
MHRFATLRLHGASLLLALGLPVISTAADAAYTFTVIDASGLFPGTVLTDTRGINNNGMLVGYASDFATDTSFQYLNGVYSGLPVPPGGLMIDALALNDSGLVVGAAFDASFTMQGFSLNAGIYTFVGRPAWNNTYFRAVNNAGLMTGMSDNFGPDGPTGTGLTDGFIYDPASHVFTSFTESFTIPGTSPLVTASFADSRVTITQGINTANQVVGSVWLPQAMTTRISGKWGFLRQPDGTTTLFRVIDNDTRTAPRGINDNGVITGFYTIPNPVDPVNLWPVQRGFVGTSAGYQFLDVPFPGAVDTWPLGINNSGQIVGNWDQGTDADGNQINWRGFIATPATLPTGTTASGAFTFTVDVIANTPIFIDPQVALGYEYEVGRGDPLFSAVRPPIGFGDDRYTVVVNNGHSFPVAGGELFDFRAHGYRNGVKKFRVVGIEDVAAVDPLNQLAFPTQVTFVDSGRFTGTMTALCLSHPLPPQAAKPAQIAALKGCLRK